MYGLCMVCVWFVYDLWCISAISIICVIVESLCMCGYLSHSKLHDTGLQIMCKNHGVAGLFAES